MEGVGGGGEEWWRCWGVQGRGRVAQKDGLSERHISSGLRRSDGVLEMQAIRERHGEKLGGSKGGREGG